VAFTVSLGPALVTVPNVVGLTQASAQSAIAAAGLTVGATTTANSATVPAGSVISENPAAGASVAPSTAIALVISSGPAPVVGVPTVDRLIFSEGLGKRTTAAFSIATPGDLLVAFAASDGPAAANAQSLTISGAGLTWTRVQRAATQFGASEIWTARAATALTNVTVSSTQSSAGVHQSLTVIAFSGVAGVGASNTAGAAVRVSRQLLPWLVGHVALDVNESFVGSSATDRAISAMPFKTSTSASDTTPDTVPITPLIKPSCTSV